MKLWPLPLLVIGSAGLFNAAPEPKPQVLVLYGNTQGYLSPCGCTYPMSGGVKRAATIVRQLQASGNAKLYWIGSNVSGVSRQDELKAEAAAESAGALSALAYGVTREEAALGQGTAFEVAQLSHGGAVSGSVEPSATNPLKQDREDDAFIVTSISMRAESTASPLSETPRAVGDAIKDLLNKASRQHKIAVLSTDAEESDARALAERYPGLDVIVYRSNADPPASPIRMGNTTLVTTGSRGKHVVAISFENKAFAGYRVVSLGPDVPDQPDISRIYLRYLQRVASENLLEQVPRVESGEFAGSGSCAKCHSAAYHIWMVSGHSRALEDLDKQHHGRDPDCVGCHVVGLNSTHGFRGQTQTPQLANVGCESCHGPARAHVLEPNSNRLPQVGEKQCVSCHTTDNSPNFQFAEYWGRVRH